MKKFLLGFSVLVVVCLLVIYFTGNFKKNSSEENKEYNLISSVTYLCDESKNISANYYQPAKISNDELGTDKVELELSDGRKLSLEQTISASGIRFANSEESLVFWSKGKTAFINELGEESYANCIELAKRQDNLSEVYKNSDRGFSIRYPKDYRLNEDYNYTALGEDKVIKGISFQIPKSLAENTNLSADSYISLETIDSDNKECAISNFVDENRELEISETKINGYDFYTASFVEPAVGNRYSQKIYTLKNDDSSECLAIRYFIHYMEIENYPEGEVLEFNEKELVQTFNSIRDSLILVK